MRMRWTPLVLGLLSIFASSTTLRSGVRTLTLEDRIEAQRAIEAVYWRHRTWPEANRGPKPSLSAVLNEETLRARVEDYLRKSNALAALWGRPITGRQLQAEMERVARESKAPEVLSELFAALDDDPVLIAETLVRQKLVERHIANAYAYDDRFHGKVRRSAERALSRARNIAELRTLGGEYQETTWRLANRAESTAKRSDHGDDLRRIVSLDREQWDLHLRKLPRMSEPMSGLEETADAFVVTAVLSAKAEEVTAATVSWRKTTLDEWWSRQRESYGTTLAEGLGAHEFVQPHGNGCVDDTWRTTFDAGIPDVVPGHTAVWTGTEMIVWGNPWGNAYGFSAGRYDPSTDTWTAMSTVGAPSARSEHTAVWTGTEMIVWGGLDNSSELNTGGRYDPATDTWTATSASPVLPSARYRHTAVWTGTEMIVWGGNDGVRLNNGFRYDPATNTWTTTSTGPGVPAARERHTAVWTGTEMIVWGGFNGSSRLNTGGRYDPATNTWTATSTGAGVPAAREDHTSVWTGTRMIVWGGSSGGSGRLNTGGRYDAATDTWTATSTGAGVPAARRDHTAVWTGTEMIVWGGYAASMFNTGGRYDPAADTWTATSVGTGVPASRQGHLAVWTGAEMIVWGGGLNTGGRYDPATDTWIATSAGANIPSARDEHTAVWTGAEMIVWGGASGSIVNTGGRYDPATNTWTTTSTGAGVPAARRGHTAVWTGTEMIVWGGGWNTGGRYDPAADTWVATSTGADVPSARWNHSAVWTGTEMIVWGSSGYLNTGGRYDPSTNTWAATSTGTNVPQGRVYNAAVWTGTRMIVWGGLRDAFTALNTGGRYDPSTDTWEPTSTGAGVPPPRTDPAAVWTGTEMIVAWGGRYDPDSDTWAPISTGASVPSVRSVSTAVWTGTEMIVWGGYDGSSGTNTGGRYDPSTDTWTATSTGAGVPSPRYEHTAVWTGTEMIIWGGGSTATSSGGLYCALTHCTGSLANCDDGDACTSDACDVGIGFCAHSPAPDGTACSDGFGCTSGETCTAGVCGGGSPSPPGELQNARFTDETTMVWDPISDAPHYDALRGQLSALPVGPGGGEELCFDEIPFAMLVDGTPPLPGTGFWYVVRGSNACGTGNYGTQSNLTPRTSSSCP